LGGSQLIGSFFKNGVVTPCQWNLQYLLFPPFCPSSYGLFVPTNDRLRPRSRSTTFRFQLSHPHAFSLFLYPTQLAVSLRSPPCVRTPLFFDLVPFGSTQGAPLPRTSPRVSFLVPFFRPPPFFFNYQPITHTKFTGPILLTPPPISTFRALSFFLNVSPDKVAAGRTLPPISGLGSIF